MLKQIVYSDLRERISYMSDGLNLAMVVKLFFVVVVEVFCITAFFFFLHDLPFPKGV